MTELLGRVPTIPIPIFHGLQKFRLVSSSIQVFIQMILRHNDLILKNLVIGHTELPYPTTMLKQTNFAVRFCKIRSKVKFSMCSQIIHSIIQLGHDDLYMTELLGRVPTIPIPIFNGIQKFQLASSSKQVFIQMIAAMGLTLSVKVNLTKSTNS